MSSVRIPCRCAQCSKAPPGFSYQMKKTAKNHSIHYPCQPLAPVTQQPSTSAHIPVENQLENPQLVNRDNLESLNRDGLMELDESFHIEDIEPLSNHQVHPSPHQNCSPSPLPQEALKCIEYFDDILPISCRNPTDMPSVIPRAFLELPHVQMAYMNAVFANVHGCLPVLDAMQQLNNVLNMFDIAGVLPEESHPVCSLAGAKSRLGIDPDRWIIQYAICPACWKHYHPQDLSKLDGPTCTVPACDRIIYSESTNGKGDIVCTPSKINPQVSIIESLCCMMMQLGFAQSIHDSYRKTCPSTEDANYLMNNMLDSSNWYNHTVKTVREIGEWGSIQDVQGNGEEEIAKLCNHRYSLNLIIDGNWFGILE
ncbi:hypothetical protein GYMLUDRAFT_65114 [Collybiopsis luxurians FD-317 M1]|uniref:Uncharacterized protein n=1 Tax=Collybiopsis luxurians FD-317 M1 TaxID=944289 RepID=A0A0D0B9E9_9AGAR|nr:hypothetical protein GYMLUDRAFT_65114 [Collybiopsis luxurians FD-317 M1]